VRLRAPLVLLAVLLAVTVLPSAERSAVTVYPVHRGVTATVFWIGEPQGGGSSEDNAVSAWDDAWLEHYGGVDEPGARRAAPGWFPTGFRPQENPFYFDLPYNDFDREGGHRPDRMRVVPWARAYAPQLALAARNGDSVSLLKNRWARIVHGGRVCYAQWEDSGPYVYDDAAYVFGHDDRRPLNRRAHQAGMDVSPAVRDCLGFVGLDTDTNKVDWQFVEATQVPDGPWKRVVTKSQVYWP
jgi:hypothetical protein